jgi:RNA polymerase sigma-70 factor, ECF subfamily
MQFLACHADQAGEPGAPRSAEDGIDELQRLQQVNAAHEEFVLFMSKHQRKVRWFISTLLPAEADTQDVLQETSLILWRKWAEFDRNRDFFTWACGIARREALRFIRGQRSKRVFLDEELLANLADAALSKGREQFDEEHRNALRICVKSLRPRERDVIRRRYDERQSPQAIAADLHSPVNTIYSLLNRSRVKLIDCVRRRMMNGGA